MKVIINAEPDDMSAVLRLIMKHRHQFDTGPQRLGWGWHFYDNDTGKTFFIRHIKDGLSASQSPSDMPKGDG